MEIQIGINANCSEIVHQICGITTDNVVDYNNRLKIYLADKYTPQYLDTFLSEILHIDVKHCLNLTDDVPDYKILSEVAKEMGVYSSCVSCCSSPIGDEKQMEEQVKWLEEKKQKDYDD